MNYYVVGNEELTKFLAADGSWVEDYNEAEQLTIEQAVEKQVELIRQEIITEIFEVPLLAEGAYSAIHARIDDLQGLLEERGINLTTNIGREDETTWTFEVQGLTLTVKLTGPDEFEFNEAED
jgi:hypothetical protein